jgi:hypothetical protein
VMADRTVRQTQFVGCPRETAMPAGGFKGAERLQGRERFEHDVKFYSQYRQKRFVGHGYLRPGQ